MKIPCLSLLILAAGSATAQMQAPPPTASERAAEQAKAVNAATPGTIDALDARNGFRQYQLGVSVSLMPSLKARGKDTYLAPDESMSVGEAKLSTLIFIADKGRLATIALSAYGDVNCAKLLDALKAQYGPSQEAGYNKQVWQGQRVTMIYERKPVIIPTSSPYLSAKERETCLVFITSNAIVAEREAERKAAAKKAAGDL